MTTKAQLLNDESGSVKNFLVHLLEKVDFDICDLSVIGAGNEFKLQFEYNRNEQPLVITEDDEAKVCYVI